MSKFSINFEDEEQYQKFIQSIKNEVIKEIPKKNINPVKNNTIWNYAKSKVDALEMRPDEEYQLKSAISTILRFGFKSRTVHLLPDGEFDEVKPTIDALFDSILSLRKHERPVAYQKHWVIKEENK